MNQDSEVHQFHGYLLAEDKKVVVDLLAGLDSRETHRREGGLMTWNMTVCGPQLWTSMKYVYVIGA